VKSSTIQLLLVLLVTAMPSLAQRFPTNSINAAQAIKLASRLSVGMREQDIAKLLDKQNGLNPGGQAGDSFGWTRFYLLADGCFLDLQMDPKEVLPLSFKFEGTNIPGNIVVVSNMWGGNGLLQSACIQSNGTWIIRIALANVPQPNGSANRSQPIRSGTNQPSWPAGSGR
jgi:hypothetical protein